MPRVKIAADLLASVVLRQYAPSSSHVFVIRYIPHTLCNMGELSGCDGTESLCVRLAVMCSQCQTSDAQSTTSSRQ